MDIEKKVFKVERIVFFNKESKWGVLAVTPMFQLPENQLKLINQYNNISVTGNFDGVYEGAEIEVSGDIVDGKYGKAIQVRTVIIKQDSKSKEGIINFLSQSLIKGISVQNAKKIYDVFKKDSIDIVLNEPWKLNNVIGIGKKTVKKVTDSVDQYKRMKPLIEFCSTLGLHYTLIIKLDEELGEEALKTVQTDPYKVLQLTNNITFKQMDEIFLKSGGSPTATVRLETGLLYVLRNLVMLEGSTGCKSSTLKSKFYAMLNLTGENSEYESIVHKLSTEGKVYVTEGAITGYETGYVYYKEYVDIEKSIAEKVHALNKYGLLGDRIKEEVVDEEIHDFPFDLNPKQVEAVHECLKHNVSVLTGAAGCLTGDTIIKYNRAKTGRQGTIRDMYVSFNKAPIKGSNGWDKAIPTYVRSYIASENRIRLNEVKDIVYSGKKEVYLLTLNDGKTLRATADHEIMTDEGFVPLIELKEGMHVMLDEFKWRQSKGINGRKEFKTQYIGIGQYHKYAQPLRHPDGKTYYRIKIHRAIYEAHINGLTLDDFKEATKHPNDLEFIDPNVYHIHHLDHNHWNNDVSNLVKIPRIEHYKEHAKGAYSHFEQGVPTYSSVVSVSYVGEEDTYDICCYENHNFVANGVVVHNSGKSSITKALSRIYRRCGFSVHHLSTTAKACRRLEECIGTNDAQTIHKFLGMKKDTEFKGGKPYAEDSVLIVDEASMLDIILFNYLLAGTTLTSRVLLIGDNHQLPSVQAGNVLGDLIDSKHVHVSELTDIMRQKENSNIIKYCSMINEGEVFEPIEAQDFHYEEFEFANELKEFFYKKYVEAVEEFGLNEVQVITPYKKGELGMENLNSFVQNKYNANGALTIEPYRMGDKVRHTQNNYKKDVYNGETGTIIRYDDEDEMMLVDFGNKVICYDKQDVAELTLSYVSTVHASQGSEYKVVFVILDDTSVNDFLLIRRLLYTAVSRGKQKVYILTKPYLVDKCIQNNSYRPRITKLKEYLQNED